jgi:hypothetical protein
MNFIPSPFPSCCPPARTYDFCACALPLAAGAAPVWQVLVRPKELADQHDEHGAGGREGRPAVSTVRPARRWTLRERPAGARRGLCPGRQDLALAHLALRGTQQEPGLGFDVELITEVVADLGEVVAALAEPAGEFRLGGLREFLVVSAALASFSALALAAASALAALAAFASGLWGSSTAGLKADPSLATPMSCLMPRMVSSGSSGMAFLNLLTPIRPPIRAISRNAAETSRAASQAGMMVARPMMAATISPTTRKRTKIRATAKEGAATPTWTPLRLSSIFAKAISSFSWRGASRKSEFKRPGQCSDAHSLAGPPAVTSAHRSRLTVHGGFGFHVLRESAAAPSPPPKLSFRFRANFGACRRRGLQRCKNPLSRA